MGELRELAAFIHDLTWVELPEAVREAVTLRVLDLVGVSMGAVENELVRAVLESSRERAGSGPCSVWGMGGGLPVAEAAKVNAMLAHTLELDDVHTASKTHGSASIIPAAWACGEYLGSMGAEVLLAIVCGYEVTARIGMALGVTAHRKRGWQPPPPAEFSAVRQRRQNCSICRWMRRFPPSAWREPRAAGCGRFWATGPTARCSTPPTRRPAG